MSEEKAKGKVVIYGNWVSKVIAFMELEKALPVGKSEIVNIKDDPIQSDIITIDFDKGKFIFSDYFYKSDKRFSYFIYLNHTYDLNKVNLDAFIKGVIVESHSILKEDFEIAITNIFKNKYLKEKFYKILEDSPDLRQGFSNRVDLIDVLKKYDVVLATKLLI